MNENTDEVCQIKMNTNDEIIEKTSDEYAYLDKGGFSSEKFKIEIRGLPKFYGIVELKKLMNDKLGLNTSKIKRPRASSHWLYACFQNEEERSKAIAALNGYSWKGKTLQAEEAKPAPDPLVRKRKQEERDGIQDKKTKPEENKSQDERVKDATTPYWNIPYEEQLKLKEKEIKHILMKFDNEVWQKYRTRRSDIEAKRQIYNGLSFELRSIERSPVTEGYRNKCEFSVGIDDESQLPTVGFRLGAYVKGTICVAPIANLNHISDKTKQAVLLFQNHVRQSKLPPFSPADYSGYWRNLTVRHSTSTGDIMLIVGIHPQELAPEELEKIKNNLIEHFSSKDATDCGIKSLYFELITKRRNLLNKHIPLEESLLDLYATLTKPGEDAAKAIHLMGSTHIIDTILGRQFRISPEAFFQVNTAGAEILYQSAIDMSQVKDDSTVVDICCGTGTIGLCFAKHCNKVLGLEVIPEAVRDAKANAELNKIDNCDFFTGKAEHILSSVLARTTADDVIAIVDPPRAGLHMGAISQLRNTKKVKRLVYISCSPASAVRNFVDLTRPCSKMLRGAPFIAIRAVPVDMFPQTKHVELAILFEREQETSSEGKNDGDVETDDVDNNEENNAVVEQ